MTTINKNYDNRIITKPWGREYNIFRINKKFAITYLKINKGSSTSLHCHPKKKTGFLILSGTAKVQLGIYSKNKYIYKPMSILVLRAGLFHRIEASKSSDLYALEIETPYIKSDLIRFADNYGRKNKDYEKLSSSKKFEKNDIIFKKPKLKEKKKYFLNGINLTLSYLDNFHKYKNFDDKTVSIVCDGEMIDNKSRTVISSGEIVKSLTLKKLEKNYKIKKKILILKASKKS